MINSHTLHSLYNVAMQAAEQAAAILREGFSNSFSIECKEGEHNLVTEYDKKSEEFIKNYLLGFYPLHDFLAEEMGEYKQGSEFTWIIDPLDGTVNFAHGLPFFSVSIALYHLNNPLLGVINMPMTGEVFSAKKNEGAYLNNKKIQVSSPNRFPTPFYVTGFPYNVVDNPAHCIDTFMKFIKKGIPMRQLGSATLDLAYVAAGRFDAFFDVYLQPWDFAAGALIVEEAGGKVTNYQGQLLPAFKPSSCIAATAYLYDELIEQLR